MLIMEIGKGLASIGVCVLIGFVMNNTHYKYDLWPLFWGFIGLSMIWNS